MYPDENKSHPGQEEYRPIDASEPRLRLDTARCLPVRSKRSTCSACAGACPVSVLSVAGDGPSLTGDCLGCGRCAAACPTDALQVDGFPHLPTPAQPAPSVTRLECWRVPDRELQAGTLRVPCLGGLDASRLLTFQRLAGRQGITLIDRGWCARCPAYGQHAGHPAGPALLEASRILAETGVPGPELPRLVREPLSERMATRSIPASRLEVRTGRRAFFRRLGGHAAATHAAAKGTGDHPSAGNPPPLMDKYIPPRRQRLVAELRATGGSATTPSMLPRLTVNSNCKGHAVCVAVCPTGALVRENANATSRLRLDAVACIACGLCETHCPEQAIHVAATSGGEPEVELNRMDQRECEDCGRLFTARRFDEDVCHPCRKSRRFAAAGFAFLTRADPAVTDENHGGKSG